MPTFKVKAPDGSIITVNAPEGATEQQAIEFAASTWKPSSKNEVSSETEKAGILKNLAGGAIKGASEIGATLLTPIDYAAKALGIQNDYVGRMDRREAINDFMRSKGIDESSVPYNVGKIGTEIAGTSGIGGVLAKPVIAAAPALNALSPYAIKLANALKSGGFNVGGSAPAGITEQLANLGIRTAGGALTGGASAGMVNPSESLSGLTIGAAMPVAAKTAGGAAKYLGSKLRGAPISQEVKDLALKAKDMGIDIPADRLIDSRPLNAIAASLNYIPFSGRTATEEKLMSQINRAASKTIGQDSANINSALKKAQIDLGRKFDDVLKNNVVNVDDTLLNDLASHADVASKELESGQAKIIQNQIDEILSKAKDGVIDGQAAYNIKKTLDRIGKQNTPVAYYAKDLKMSLMDALNRSIGPEEAANFAKTREQYGNMIALEKKAARGAEGEISMGKLANLPNVRSEELNDIADIAAQFGRTRENPHGAAQRAFIGAAIASLGGLPAYALGVAGGRATNTALNSNVLRNMLLQEQNPQINSLINNVQPLIYRSAPIFAAQ